MSNVDPRQHSEGHNRVAAFCLAALFLYYEAFRWIPLGRWNWQFHFPISNDQFIPDIVIGILLLWFAISFARGLRVGMIVACALLSLWSVVHFFDWWLPYLRNNPANFPRYSFYAPHTQILPVVAHHYPPDGAHAVLDFVLYPTCIICYWAMLASRRNN